MNNASLNRRSDYAMFTLVTFIYVHCTLCETEKRSNDPAWRRLYNV